MVVIVLVLVLVVVLVLLCVGVSQGREWWGIFNAPIQYPQMPIGNKVRTIKATMSKEVKCLLPNCTKLPKRVKHNCTLPLVYEYLRVYALLDLSPARP